MCHVERTLLTIVPSDSQMNPEERKRHPMVANYGRTTTSAWMFTWLRLYRDGHLLKTLQTLCGQPEVATVYVTLNNYTAEQYKETMAGIKDSGSVVTLAPNRERQTRLPITYAFRVSDSPLRLDLHKAWRFGGIKQFPTGKPTAIKLEHRRFPVDHGQRSSAFQEDRNSPSHRPCGRHHSAIRRACRWVVIRL